MRISTQFHRISLEFDLFEIKFSAKRKRKIPYFNPLIAYTIDLQQFKNVRQTLLARSRFASVIRKFLLCSAFVMYKMVVLFQHPSTDSYMKRTHITRVTERDWGRMINICTEISPSHMCHRSSRRGCEKRGWKWWWGEETRTKLKKETNRGYNLIETN